MAARASARSGSGLKEQEVLADSLRAGIERLHLKPHSTEWTRYEEDRPTYSGEAWEAKGATLRRVLERLKPATIWDLGMATGRFSREASAAGALTIGFDADPYCVDRAYLQARERGDTRFLPLVQDLLRPTTAGGWAGAETLSLAERGPADLLLVLGLTHHLAVAGAVPFSLQLEHFARLGRAALVEFVPATDPVVRWWSTRFDVSGLTREAFEAAIGPAFTRAERIPLPGSDRVIYLLTQG
jgi:hypothetical protein